jgi:hypothetical protein
VGDFGPELPKIEVCCKCPTCGKEHRMWLRWVGRHMPRKICPGCRKNVGYIDGDYIFEIPESTNLFK